ncbi:hypothetical protein [Botrimarina hoheduenensis]|uniref:Uncharacterized protein n=1 Tax=Botrimarina hoheduenensis TaxID=2528000 RepID=A0A5C5VXL6_9BACT|nr:hypothetical protein [Botrimarina hoheduenensis]TWT42877.1 hypothetical protein Pla111_25150 [Botrimarina hoheduenensis]
MNPKSLIDELDRAGHAQRREAVASWVLGVLFSFIATAIVLGLLDYFVRSRDQGLRWVATAALLGVTSVVAWRWGKRRLGQRTDRLALAERIERHRPERGSQLSSAVAFYDQEADDPTAGSAELRRAVIVDAAQNTPLEVIRQEVDRAPRRQLTRRLAVLACLMMGLTITNPAATRIAAERLLAPWADIAWPRLTQLHVIEAPTSVAAGGTFEVVVGNHTGAVPSDAIMEVRYGSAAPEAQPDNQPKSEVRSLQPLADDAVGRLEEVRRSFAFRVVGGDDDSMAWQEVDVLEAPHAIEFKLRTLPPAYSGLASAEVTGPLRVMVGTRLDLAGLASQPLSTATVVAGEENFALTIDPADPARFALGQQVWNTEVPLTPGSTYCIKLAATSGVTGSTNAHPYEVRPDSAPTTQWQPATDDDYVTARAVVSLCLLVQDDLAIERVIMQWSIAAGDDEEAPPPEELILYAGPTEPPRRQSLEEGDRQPIDFEWDLAPLGLPPNTEIAIVASASDYKPNTTNAPRPTNLVVISDEDFEARLATEQSRLVEEITRALELQRTAALAAKNAAIEAADGQTESGKARDAIGSAEYQQRLASESIDDPRGGVRALAQRLTDRARRNRLDRPEMVERLARAADELSTIVESPQSEARRELATARRDSQSKTLEGVAERLAVATAHQQEATKRLESLADSLAGWADYGRFAQELLEMQKTQNETLAQTRQEAAAAAQRDPLAAAQRQANREKLLASQADLQRRFARLEQSMRGLLDQEPGTADQESERAVDAVRDALDEAAESGVGAALREASRELATNRLGSATKGQAAAAEGLEQMLETLRGGASNDPDRLIGQLQKAQERLNALGEAVAQDANNFSADQASREELAKNAERLGRQLDRLTAPRAANAMQAAANQLENAGESPSNPPGDSPEGAEQGSGQQASAGQAGGASQGDAQLSMQQASREIDRRIDQLENEATQRLLDRLAQRIAEYVDQQEEVLQRTMQADISQAPVSAIAALRDDQSQLRDTLAKASVALQRRAVFEIALRGVAAEMNEATQRLAQADTSRLTQRFEAAALRRLKAIAEVLEQNQAEKEEQEEQGGGGGGGGGESPPPSPVDLAELKMLRLTQLELISQTDAYEADTARGERLRDPQMMPPPEVAAQLAAEQRRLAELATELAERTNDPDAESEPHDSF